MSEKIKCYRVYEAKDGCDPCFVGEYLYLSEAEEAAEAEHGGLPRAMWGTALAAGHCAGQSAPSPLAAGEREATEPLSWHGASGWHCVVPVYCPLSAEDLEDE